MEIDVNDEVLGFCLRGFGKEFALGTRHEAGAPELDAIGLSAGIGLMSYPIHSHDGEAVGHGMTPLHELPSLALALLFVRRIAALIAYGGGIDEDVGASEGHQTCSFGVPLIPADLHAEVAHGGLDGLETEVARSEVELLVVGRVIGNMHLAMDTGDGAISLEDNSCIVVKPRCPAFEEAGDEYNAMLTRKGAEELGRRTRNGFGKVEVIDGLHLTEIGRVVELLKHNELSSTRGYIGDGGSEAGAVVRRSGCAGLLDEGGFHRVNGRWTMENGRWKMGNGQCKPNTAQPLERSEALPLTGERGEGLGMGTGK
jgi:hypothetical protein